MRRTTLALLTTCLLVAAPPALAQDHLTDVDPGLQQPDWALGPTINVQFPGGTLADYIETITLAAGSMAPTVMVRGDAGAIRVGPVELRQIAMVSALDLLNGYHASDENPRAFRVETEDVGAAAGGEPAFLVNIADGRGSGPVVRDFRVLPIREITEALPGDPPEIVLPAETVLTAIETVIEITDANGPGTEIRFHPESGLLMLAGPSSSLDAAEAVLERIFSDVENRRDRARDLQRAQGLTNPDMLEQQLADAKAEAEIAEVRFAQLQRRLDMSRESLEAMRAQAEAGAVSQGDFDTAQIQVWEQETLAREQQIKLERTMQMVQRLEADVRRSYEVVAGGGPEGGDETRALREENAMLRERLAALEARVADLNNQLKGRGERGR